MSAISSVLNRWLSLLGAPGVIGVGLLLFSLGLYDSSIAPAAQQLTAMQAKIVKLQ